MRLFCDCKTDEEKSNFILSGRAVETGVIAPAISNDVAMAYHRCAQFKKENDELRARIREMERRLPRTHEIHECFMRSTGDRDKHPAPLCALAKLALTDDVQPTPSEEARLVSYHPDGDTCTLNINGVEMYYDRVDRDTQPAPSVPVDLITDYLVSISAHVAHQDDPKAQAEIGELLRMLAAASETKP